MDNVKKEFRQEAIDWLNSKERSLEKGLELLKNANYKPNVVANFERNKNRRDIPRKLEIEIRYYIRYCTNPDSNNGLHEDEIPAEDPDNKFEGRIEQELKTVYPGIVTKLLTEVRELYVERSKQHNALKKVGESNDEKSMKERERIGYVMDAASRRMDVLWKAFQVYKESGTLPDESLFSEPFDPNKIAQNKTDKADKKDKAITLPDDLQALKKMSENWRTKIVKAENKLNYQSEKKADKKNPMPAGPKRTSQEKRIAKLKDEKTAIDTKIAALK